MITWRQTRFLAALWAAGAWLGCSGGGGGAPDATADADTRPDAFDLCPGQLTFEALIADAQSGDPVPIATVRDTGGGPSTTSAPNGRAILCLDQEDFTLELSKTDYLTTTYALDGDVLATGQATLPFPGPMIAPADADALVSSVGQTRDGAAGLLLVDVRTYPGAEPATGAEVSISNANAGAFADDVAGDFSAGSTVAAGGRILFVNAALEGGSATLTVTPPPNKSCAAAADVPLEGGAFSYTLVACQ